MNVKNNRGMTLVEIVVAIGVLGLMATVFASSFAEVFKAQKMVEHKDRANDFASTFGHYLTAGTGCSSGLTNLNIPAANGEQSITLNDYFKDTSGASKDLKAGAEIESNVLRVKDILLSNSGATPQQVHANGQDLIRHIAKIQLKLEIMSKGNWIETSPRFYEVPVFTNPTGKISSCGEEMSKDDACRLIGSIVDPATGRCMPSTNCSFNGHYIDASCSHSSSGCPRDVNNDITKKTQCPDGTAEKQSGDYSWSFTESCGKKCSRTVRARQKFYICVSCS